MTLDHRRIETIVSEVLERLEAQRAGREAGARPGPASPLGVHPDLDAGVIPPGGNVECAEGHRPVDELYDGRRPMDGSDPEATRGQRS